MKRSTKTVSAQRLVGLEEYYQALLRAMDSYETDHPHWWLEVLVSFIKWSLRCLRYHVENRRTKGISWNSPFVELRYPVEWNWEGARGGDVSRSNFVSGRMTKRNTANSDLASRTLTKIMVSHLNAMALHGLTNQAWWEKHDNYYTPYLPVEFDAQLNAVKSKRARREAFEQLVRPFSIGAASIDYGGMEFKEGARVPKEVGRRLGKINQFMDMEPIMFSGEVNGRKVEISLVFQIHPLIADYDSKEAYHSITVGLVTSVPDESGVRVLESPAKWPRKDRMALWQELLAVLDTLTGQLIPKPQTQASKIFQFNGELEIPPGICPSGRENEHLQQLVKTLCESGNLRKFSHKLLVSDKACLDSGREPLEQLLLRVEEAKTAAEKGRTLEALVSCLFKSVPGFTVQENTRTETEEIDLTITNASEDPRLQREAAFILAECKNWSAKCGKNEFVVLKDKMLNRKGRCSLGFLISWNGFADTITSEMLRVSRERILIVPIDGSQIRNAVRTGRFFETIMSALDRALLT